MQEIPICPDNWLEEMDKNLDFEASFNALDGFEHFHSYILRGWMKTHLLELDEALEHLKTAEKLYSNFEPTPDNQRRKFLIYAQSFEINFIKECREGTSEAELETNNSLRTVLSHHEDPNPVTKNLLLRATGAFKLLRGEFSSALQDYENYLEITKSDPEANPYPYAGAAAASHELGYLKQARRHYQNLDFSLSFSSERLTFYLLSCWLCALCRHWGWINESDRWKSTMEVMDCPQSSKELLMERSRILRSTIKGGTTIPIF